MTVAADAEEGILGRLHAARQLEIDLPGMARLVELSRKTLTAQPWTVDGDLFVSFRGGMRPLLHHGDLRVRGSLLIDDHSWLICTGNLIVDGIVSNHQPSTLAVGGNLMARRLVTSGRVLASKSIHVTEAALVRGMSTPLVAAESFWAPTLIHEGPNVSATALVVERSIDVNDPAQRSLHQGALALDALTDSGEIDPERCDRLLRCGLSLFGV